MYGGVYFAQTAYAVIPLIGSGSSAPVVTSTTPITLDDQPQAIYLNEQETTIYL